MPQLRHRKTPANRDGRIRYGETKAGAATRIFHLCQPRAVIFSPDGRLLAAAGRCDGNRGQLKVWQVADGRLLCRAELGPGGNPVIAFSPNSTVMASTGDGIGLSIWKLPAGVLQRAVIVEKPVLHLAFSDEGKTLIGLCADGGILQFPAP